MKDCFSMRGSRILLAALAAGMLAASMYPAGALPPGAPVVGLSPSRQENLTYVLAAQASDPDGDVTRIEVCVEENCTEQRFAGSDGVEEVTTCLNGDTETLAILHTFPAAGLFEVTVRATGGGCPLIGSPETTTETFEVQVEAPPPPPPVREPIPCADEGPLAATDRGVDATGVTLGMVVPRSGIASAWRAAIYDGAEAARIAIDRAGGVCGRELRLKVLDDGGDDVRRRLFLNNMIAGDEVFAIVATRVDDVLTELEEARVPAIGTPAEVRTEFGSPWAWPVSPGNDAFGWIAVDEAYADGARTFALVYDGERPIGRETREAVEAAVASHPDATLVHESAVPSGASSYPDEVMALDQACTDGCDSLIYALDPATMLTWMATPGSPSPRAQRSDAIPLVVSRDFAQACQAKCDGLRIWTPYEAVAGGSSGEVAARYCEDLRYARPSADCLSALAEAGYTAVYLAARAIGLAGVDLTRDRVREALDARPFDLDLTGGRFEYPAPRRQANRWMRAYSIEYKGTFGGYRDVTGWREDPR